MKQDAIPGMLIPIHFVPTKTSDQMREELATDRHASLDQEP